MDRPNIKAKGPEPPNPAGRDRTRAPTKSEKIVNPPRTTERKKGPYTGAPKK